MHFPGAARSAYCAILVAAGVAQAAAKAAVDVPLASNFIRRAHHASGVLGDFLYIDGGDFSQYVDGTLDTKLPRMNNKTLSIDLRKPWTNESVEINTIAKGDAPVWKFADLWPDKANNAFYAWTGETVGGAVPSLALWKFTPDNAGGGAWARETPVDAASFNQLARPAGGYSAASNGAGFYLGGYTSAATDRRWAGSAGFSPVPGMVSFNYTTGEWRNVSAKAFTTHGTQFWGQMEEVPFGPEGRGLLVMMGGESGSENVILNTAGQLSFGNITMYDPVEGTWFSQVTTGDAPSVRDGFCLVGAQGANGTYELFLYGGWTASLGNVYNDVYVLSLPGFHWFKGPSQGQPRMDHTCEVIGNSSRQLVAIGGLALQGEKWEEPDDLRNGLGVLDMKTMEWASTYDPDVEAYDTPEDIQAWYNEGNSDPAWTSDTVRELFSSATTGNSDTISSTSTSASSSASTNNASSTHTGAIVGGVIGGVAAVLLGLAALWFLRRRRRQRAAAEAALPGPGKSEEALQEMQDSSMYELPPDAQNAELDENGAAKVELDSQGVPRWQKVGGPGGVYELPGHPQ